MLDPCPVSPAEFKLTDTTSTFSPDDDNLKWSVDLEKIIKDRFFVNLRVASDHLRITTELWTPAQYDLLTKPEDFYWSLKMGYSF
jgi:hypothetical protein